MLGRRRMSILSQSRKDEWESWKRLGAVLGRLRGTECSTVADECQRDHRCIRLALRELKIHTELTSLPLVTVFHSLVKKFFRTRTLCHETPQPFTEVSLALLPRIIMRVLRFWMDQTRALIDLKRDVESVVSADFLQAINLAYPTFECGAGPFLLLLLPFDPVVWYSSQWVRDNLSLLLNHSAPPPPSTEPRLIHLLALYCSRPQLLFGAKQRRWRPVAQPRKAKKRQAEEPLEYPDRMTGVTGILDVEKQILSFATPRSLRCCEMTCRTWAAIVDTSPSLRSLLTLGGFLQRRYVRFFEELWGDIYLRLDSLAAVLLQAEFSQGTKYLSGPDDDCDAMLRSFLADPRCGA
eukprot:Sspe_Gene.58805::Locus_32290_Transcript_2_3_Confidence_0.286_Length_2081::g.58805::m.58805